MIKEAVVLKINDKPIACLDIKKFDDPKDFNELQAECEKNKKELLELFKDFEKRLNKLELRLARDEGEITEEEFNGMVE